MSVDFEHKQNYTISDLLKIVGLLRGNGGCPWDREQNHHSIRKNFLEETYEAIEAIDNNDSILLREELGDVLLQIVFHTQMESEAGVFSFDDVCDGICKKLIERHPHVFSTVKVSGTNEVLYNWDKIKAQTKGRSTGTEMLKSVPVTLPALMRSEKVQHRAAKCGFDYPDGKMAMRDLKSELDELCEAIDEQSTAHIAEELGDLLFSVVNVSRFVNVDSEQCLSKSCEKFISRFEKVERMAAERGINMSDAGLETLDALWHEAKKQN